jgi:two-component system, chemotaxis family, response regulator Rcp1
MEEMIQILLVEDNEGDIILAMEALTSGKIANRISVVRDGQQALDYLNRQNGFEKAITPDLILLDINLPKMDGKEVLTIIKQDERLRVIPVVMLTTSSSENDVLDAYYNHANCYITKPVDLEKFLGIVHKIENFWLSVVRFPPKN